MTHDTEANCGAAPKKGGGYVWSDEEATIAPREARHLKPLPPDPPCRASKPQKAPCF